MLPRRVSPSSSLSLSSLELSDTKVHDPYIRALLGTALHSCEVVILKFRTVLAEFLLAGVNSGAGAAWLAGRGVSLHARAEEGGAGKESLHSALTLLECCPVKRTYR